MLPGCPSKRSLGSPDGHQHCRTRNDNARELAFLGGRARPAPVPGAFGDSLLRAKRPRGGSAGSPRALEGHQRFAPRARRVARQNAKEREAAKHPAERNAASPSPEAARRALSSLPQCFSAQLIPWAGGRNAATASLATREGGRATARNCSRCSTHEVHRARSVTTARQRRFGAQAQEHGNGANSLGPSSRPATFIDLSQQG